MGQITSSVGLVSGINTGAIINELLALDQVPVTVLQTKINSDTAQTKAYADLQTDLQTLQVTAQALQMPTTFKASSTNSSNSNVLTATAGAGAPEGSYQFQVAQLVSAQQTISNGYTSPNATMAPGTITLTLGGGDLNAQTNLSDLNGGAGVSRGQFRITDASGQTNVIDTSNDVTLDDVVKQINNSLNINVQASVQGNKLVLTDESGGSGTLSVKDIGGGAAAASLGIAGTASGGTLTGSAISYVGTGTALSALNDGRGIRLTTGTGDFTVTDATGKSYTVSLATAQTVGDVLTAINTATGGKVKASVGQGANGITLTDQSGGSGGVKVADINGSHAAEDLGIQQTSGSGTINGSAILAGIDTVLVSSLKGGSGIQLGQINITNRQGTVTSVNLAGSQTVQDILDKINNATGGTVTASLNPSTDGIQLQDNTGGSGNLVIADANGGVTAQSLGLAGTFDTTHTVVDGGDLHVQFVSQNTLLSNYNGGKGVGTGSFTITNAAGLSATLDLSKGTFNTIGDVINAVNAKNIGVTASINANGNGISLTDNSGGAGVFSVKDVTGTSAASLHLTGAPTGNTIDGALQQTIQVTAQDTLQTVQAKIQALSFGVAANIINDGTAQSPYHLSLTALNSGTAGRVVIDTGSTGLQMRNLVNAQDAAVFYGGVGSGQPMLVTSSTNQITNVIPGVTLSLVSASSSPVTLSITRDGSGIEKDLQTFSDTFNGLIDKINTYTKYDTTTNTAGLLLGDPTTLQIQQQLYTVFSSVVSSAGTFRTIGDAGLTLTDGAKIKFDATAFEQAFAQDPDSIKTLFTQSTTGLATVINNSMNALIDPVSGTITQENKTISTETQSFQDQITQLNAIIANKKQVLETQFANMESVLSNLQSQQAALGSLSSLASIKSTGSSSSSGSGSSSSSSH